MNSIAGKLELLFNLRKRKEIHECSVCGRHHEIETGILSPKEFNKATKEFFEESETQTKAKSNSLVGKSPPTYPKRTK